MAKGCITVKVELGDVEVKKVKLEVYKKGKIVSISDRQVSQTNISEVRKTISNLLLDMGIKATHTGYHYLVTALELVLDDETALKSVTKGLYIDVAQIYRTSDASIERAIRHAIEVVWETGNRPLLNEIFHGNYLEYRPTNTQFMAGVVEYLKLNFNY